MSNLDGLFINRPEEMWCMPTALADIRLQECEAAVVGLVWQQPMPKGWEHAARRPPLASRHIVSAEVRSEIA